LGAAKLSVGHDRASDHLKKMLEKSSLFRACAFSPNDLTPKKLVFYPKQNNAPFLRMFVSPKQKIKMASFLRKEIKIATFHSMFFLRNKKKH
jgi:hypothetical protein